jgi:hypothetical protein
MYYKAKLEVPATDNCDAIRENGLSDTMAMSYGRLFASTLSDEHEFVIVKLNSGSVRIIGLDTWTGKLTIGRLHPNYRMHQPKEY